MSETQQEQEQQIATDVGVEQTNNEFKSPLESKAYDLMCAGRSLNSRDTFNQEAFDLFSKAIKLNPFLIEAWIELTTCYQKKCDIDGAISCLENALKYCDSEKPNKIILRKLSICIRQKVCNTQEAKVAALLRSLELSKQALKTDLYDEENYYNLAKAYMCLFFVTECVDQQLINLSKAAFVKALTLSDENLTKRQNQDSFKLTSIVDSAKTSSSSNLNLEQEDESKPFIERSDFLFNYSSVLLYLQDFQKALELLRLAIKLDPDWAEPRNLEECVVDYLRQIHSMTNELSKNNKKIVRRYSKVVETLRDVDKVEKIIQADQQRLSKSLDVKVESITLDSLESTSTTTKETANNVVKLLNVKLLNTINYNQAMYLTFVAVDKNYSIIVVTIYNLAASRCPSPKDVVTIVEPKIDEIKVENLIGKGSEISYRRINVREFKSLYVNGYRITTDQVSKPQFSVSILP